MLRIVAAQFFEHRFAVLGLIMIVWIVLRAVFAPVLRQLLGVDPFSQSIFNRYKPNLTVLEKSQDEREELVEQFIAKDQARATAVIATLRETGLVSPKVSEADVLFKVMDLTGLSPATLRPIFWLRCWCRSR